jgi:predicted alpha/beta-fold hydrolase
LVISEIELNLPELEPVLKVKTGHSQTLIGHFIKTPDFIQPFDIEYVRFSDGDQSGLKIYENKSKNKKNIVISLYHGLSGSHKSDYIQRSAQVAFDAGWTVVMVDHRGAGLAEGMAKSPYHSGRGQDISDVLSYLKNRFKNYVQVANAFSMSGSILLNLISGRNGHVLPDYSIVVNAPVNLQSAAELLTKGLSKIYDLRFYRKLRSDIKKNYQMDLPLMGTTQDIDDIFTSKKSGFIDKNDYYEKCSTQSHVQNIQTPTFVLTSKDDPFVSFGNYKNLAWPNCVHVTYSKYGGHMGYFSKNEVSHNGQSFKKRWMDLYHQRVFEKIEEHIFNNSVS